MPTLITMSNIILIVSIIMMLLASSLSKKTSKDREKNSPFECGFDPKSSARLPFSLRFFLIAMIFLIFDVEIALLLPTAIIMQFSHLISWSLSSTFFLLILLMGVYHEWKQGALTWAS
uniref:NADH-ubiquinone oxidoreductase chain 3 n=1 Tax=Lipotactes tripyrga TaxID=948390 RepID=A0A1Q1MPY2_9ORTH|nr:NADH dehydrogenase subunit 3 [Lipotactes tripyrga]AQM40128.1 NADH dehydrogenase subunit 3 [Lipotactes tripyrga]